MKPTTVVLITGHPASGKTTLARHLAKEIGFPLLCKDDLKETLHDTLGWSTVEWSRKLGNASWFLLYQQVEMLLQAQVDHIVEGNFDPTYATRQWQKLTRQFTLKVIQVRCECAPDILLKRYRERIQQGKRHPGHVDQSDDPAFHEAVHRGPIGWIEVEGERISVDTTQLAIEEYTLAAKTVARLAAGS